MSKDGPILGLAISDDDGTLYIAGDRRVTNIEDTDGDGNGDSRTVIIDNLPAFAYVNHSNNGLAIGFVKLAQIPMVEPHQH